MQDKIVKITIRDKPEWYGQENLEVKRLVRKYEKLYRSLDKKAKKIQIHK